MDFIAEPANKAGTVATCDSIEVLFNIGFRRGTSSITCLKENLLSLHLGLLFNEFSPFYEQSNAKIGEMISAGLIEFWINSLMDPAGRRTKPPEDVGPQILTMEHLEAAFIVCFVPLIASFVAFFIEVSFPIVKRCLKFKK